MGIHYDRLMIAPGDGTITKAPLPVRNALEPAAPRRLYLYFEPDSAFFTSEQLDSLAVNITFPGNFLPASPRIDSASRGG